MPLTLLSALAAFLISLVFTPLMRRLAIRFGVIAVSNHRTIHASTVPKLGGVAIALAFAAGGLILHPTASETELGAGLLIGAGMVMLLGLFDDIYVLSCYTKLAVQTMAATLAVTHGFVIQTIDLPLAATLDLGVWAFPVSVFWIVSVTNALNLLDGLDGLAAGFSVLAGTLILIVAGMTGNAAVAAAAMVFVGATLGFLKYNLPPARIFMGDSGSLFLGFCLACLSMNVFTFGESGTHLGALLVPFGIPLIDTTLAVVRRISERHHPFWADKKHIHHRLLDLGFRQLSAILIIYAVTILLAVVSLVLLFINLEQSLLILGGLFFPFVVGLFHLGCFDFLARRDAFEQPGGREVKKREPVR
ncbi:MAG: glycosyltransferase family 4 protein [bacterium]